MNATALTPELSTLINAARVLPPELIRQVAEFAQFLGTKHATATVDSSDEWSEGDMREVTLAAMRRFEAEHPDDDWGTDYTAGGSK